MVLELKNICKNYGKKTVLKDLNLKIEKGEIVAIVGENGSGKSTLFKIILGLIARYSGEKVFGEGITGTGIIEDVCFFPTLTGRENLEALLDNDKKSNMAKYCEMFCVNDYLDKRVGRYSMGMKQRLGIVYTLCTESDLFIFDEPTNALDARGTNDFKKTVRTLKENGKSIIISSHNLISLNNFCDKAYLLKNNCLVSDLLEKHSILTEYCFEFFNEEIAKIAIHDFPEGSKREGVKIFTNLAKEDLPAFLRRIVKHDLVVVNEIKDDLEKKFFEAIK